MRISLFLSLLYSSAFAAEVTLNSLEKTIITYPDDIIATNCSPHALGSLSAISGFSSPAGQKVLQFIPYSKKGLVVCSAKTLNHGVITTRFRLLPGIKNPIVEISPEKNKPKVANLAEFEDYILDKKSKFPKIDISGRFQSENFKYKIIEKRQASTHLYLYKFLVTPKNNETGFIRLNNSAYSPIIFSHHKDESFKEIPGIAKDKKSYLYLMTSKSINLHIFKRHLR